MLQKRIFNNLNEHPIFKKNLNLNKSTNLIDKQQPHNEPMITITDYSFKNIKSSSISNLLDQPFTLYSSTEFLYPLSKLNIKSSSMSQTNLLSLANNGYLQPLTNNDYIQPIQRDVSALIEKDQNEPIEKDCYLQPFPLPEIANQNYLNLKISKEKNNNFITPNDRHLNSIDLVKFI